MFPKKLGKNSFQNHKMGPEMPPQLEPDVIFQLATGAGDDHQRRQPAPPVEQRGSGINLINLHFSQ
jgi:hypothetical protein